MRFSKCYVLAQAWSGFPRPLLQLGITACGIETYLQEPEDQYSLLLQLGITACGIETLSNKVFLMFICCNWALPLAVLKLNAVRIFSAMISCNWTLPLAVLKRIHDINLIIIIIFVATGHYRLRY